MNIFQLVIRWLLRLKWWFLVLPLVIASLAIFWTRSLDQHYDTDLTIYTGVISSYGSDPGQSTSNPDWNMLNNSIQNIITTIQSKETLRQLSIQLYARLMIHGDPNADNTYIRASHYKELLKITPGDVLMLIDKSSEAKTVENLIAYEKPNRGNFIYGLLNWSHPYFSYTALKDNLKIKRLDNSDILQISYETNDPGIAYQTLVVLSDIFSVEYRKLQFSTTNNVIRYFEDELERVGRDLRLQEDSLTTFNVENRVISYDKQAEAIAILDKEFSMRAQEVYFLYNNTQAALTELEKRLDGNVISIKNNTNFLNKLNKISNVTYDISQVRTQNPDSLSKKEGQYLNRLNKDLEKQEGEFRDFMGQYITEKYTRDGYPNSNYVTQWVDELIKFKKAEAEVKVVRNFQDSLDKKYTHYSPIGSVLKRKERSINFSEQSYLSILSSLNGARLRLKSLEMNSAVLKVINPPSYPLSSLPSKRKMIVAGAYFGTLILLFGFFLLLELLDRSLRDKARAERLTKTRVIGALPKANVFTSNKVAVEQKMMHIVANHLYGLYRPEVPLNLINVCSLSPLQDGAIVSEMLTEYWTQLGIQVKALYEGKDFKVDSRDYLVGNAWKEQLADYDISIVQHASLSDSLIPTIFLEDGLVALVVLESNSIFSNEEETLLNTLKERMGDKPVLICLINAKKFVIEEFTGLLPPYTFLRRLGYRLTNFGWSSK